MQIFSYRSRKTLFAMLLAGMSSPLATAQELLWSDEFDSGSQPSPDVWSYDLGTGQNGWGNWELQTYTNSPANAAVENGQLVITVRAMMSGDDVVGFTSARIRTQDKLMVRYGRIEARIKMPDLHRGLWPAFWTLGNSFSQVGWPDCGEIDIMEMGSHESISTNRTNRQVGSTAHWENLGGHSYYGQSLVANEDLDEDFHLFTLDWTPSLLTTYLDGQKIWAMDITPEQCSDCSEFHEPHFIILNVAVGGSYTQIDSMGSITAPLPAEMRVDYVRVYDNGFTEVSGPASEPPKDNPLRSARARAAERIADTLQPQTNDCGDPSCDTADSDKGQAASKRDLARIEAPDTQETMPIPALGHSGRTLLILTLLGVAYRAIR